MPTDAITAPAPEPDLGALAAYLDQQFAADGPPTQWQIEVLAGGRSNLTYLVRGDAGSVVVRRPPMGPLLPTAHDMTREHRVLTALSAVGFPVPQPLDLCTDLDVIGVPFYVMEFVDGVVLQRHDEFTAMSAESAAGASRELMRILAALHRLRPDDIGLADYGRPAGFVERQINRWWSQWTRSRTRDLDDVERLKDKLTRAIPTHETAAAVVHGDYRLENVVLAGVQQPNIRAVLDWELSTLGDPLADLGFTLMYWSTEGGPILSEEPDASLAGVGFLDRSAMADEYASLSGIDTSYLDFYLALAHFKTAVIFEGIHARHLAGNTVGKGFELFGQRVPALIDAALEVCANSPIAALRH